MDHDLNMLTAALKASFYKSKNLLAIGLITRIFVR